MSEWRTQPLSDVAKVIDSLHKTPTYEDHGFPMVRVTDIQGGYLDVSNTFKVSKVTYEEFAKKHRPKHGDLVFSRVGTYGSVSFVKNDTPFCLGQNTVFIIPKSNPYFLFYFLNSPYAHHQITSFATGSTQKTISLASIKSINVFTPSPEEQENIASVLSCLDRKIENLRKQNETLEAIAQTLFKHWFIDFEFPNADGNPYKSSGGEMELSELGKIPAGWRVVRMEEIADRIAMGPFGSRITTDNFVDSGVPVIRGGNLVNGFNEKDFVYLTEEKSDTLKSSNAFPEDIIFTHRGTLGQVGFIPTNSKCPRYVVSQSQMLLGVNKSIASPRLVYRFFCSKIGLNAILANKNTTGVPSIGRPTTTLKSIQIALPENRIMYQFDALIKATDFKKETNDRQIKTLTKTRDVLLPKLMSGKLRINP